MRIKSFTKYSGMVCPRCRGGLTPLPQFEGRPRYYCKKCEEEIVNFPWKRDTTYPQDDTGFSPSSNLEGYR